MANHYFKYRDPENNFQTLSIQGVSNLFIYHEVWESMIAEVTVAKIRDNQIDVHLSFRRPFGLKERDYILLEGISPKKIKVKSDVRMRSTVAKHKLKLDIDFVTFKRPTGTNAHPVTVITNEKNDVPIKRDVYAKKIEILTLGSLPPSPVMMLQPQLNSQHSKMSNCLPLSRRLSRISQEENICSPGEENIWKSHHLMKSPSLKIRSFAYYEESQISGNGPKQQQTPPSESPLKSDCLIGLRRELDLLKDQFSRLERLQFSNFLPPI
jgi:hypothetical protein